MGRDASVAFAYLKRRAEHELGWELIAAARPGMNNDATIDFRLGRQVQSRADSPMKQLFDKDASAVMSTTERDTIYMEALAKVGMNVSQEQLERMRADEKSRTDKQQRKPVREHRKGNIRWQQ